MENKRLIRLIIATWAVAIIAIVCGIMAIIFMINFTIAYSAQMEKKFELEKIQVQQMLDNNRKEVVSEVKDYVMTHTPEDGKDGRDGKNGLNGATGAAGKDGANGTDGKDGASAQPLRIIGQHQDIVANTTVVEMSDGSQIMIPNGEAGAKGDDGFSYITRCNTQLNFMEYSSDFTTWYFLLNNGVPVSCN